MCQSFNGDTDIQGKDFPLYQRRRSYLGANYLVIITQQTFYPAYSVKVTPKMANDQSVQVKLFTKDKKH